MPTYYPQEAGDVVICVLVFLAAVFGLAAWLADRYDVRNPLKYDDEGDFNAIPDQAAIAAQHCAKVNAKRAEVRNA